MVSRKFDKNNCICPEPQLYSCQSQPDYCQLKFCNCHVFSDSLRAMFIDENNKICHVINNRQLHFLELGPVHTMRIIIILFYPKKVSSDRNGMWIDFLFLFTRSQIRFISGQTVRGRPNCVHTVSSFHILYYVQTAAGIISGLKALLTQNDF